MGSPRSLELLGQQGVGPVGTVAASDKAWSFGSSVAAAVAASQQEGIDDCALAARRAKTMIPLFCCLLSVFLPFDGL